ncbi:MAG: hypothetical protein AAGA48_25415 [Myxococcota bacterium]
MQLQGRRGQYAMLLAAGVVPVIAVGALSIDLTRASLAASEAELVAYSAAQTAIVAYNKGHTTSEAQAIADQLVRAYVAKDGGTFVLEPLTWGTVDRKSGTLVSNAEIEATQATVRRTGDRALNTVFGGFFGVTGVDLSGIAISDTLPRVFDADDCDSSVNYRRPRKGISKRDFSATVEVTLEDVPREGWYAVYKNEVAESGASQRNESGYYRVYNEANPAGLPLEGNCNGEYIVQDYDNDGRIPDRVYLGTFYFDGSSENVLQMRHYCAIRDTCPSMEDDQHECGRTWDSIHLDRGEASLCLESL